MVSPTSFCSGSEDGTVKIWDSRSPACLHTMDPSIKSMAEPTEKKSTSRRSWIGCMAVDDSQSWMVCGGGQHCLFLYHLASLSVTATMPTAGTPQAVAFDSDRIISAGNEKYIYQWSKAGKYKGRAESSSSSVFSISPLKFKKSTDNILAITGNNPKVDLFCGDSPFPLVLQFGLES